MRAAGNFGTDGQKFLTKARNAAACRHREKARARSESRRSTVEYDPPVGKRHEVRRGGHELRGRTSEGDTGEQDERRAPAGAARNGLPDALHAIRIETGERVLAHEHGRQVHHRVRKAEQAAFEDPEASERAPRKGLCAHKFEALLRT